MMIAARMMEQAHAIKFKRIMGLIKAMHGEVYGACVRDVILDDPTAMKEIKCRFKDKRSVYTLIAVLRVDYPLTDQTDEVTEGAFTCACIRVHVTTMVKHMWMIDRPIFDVDALASTTTSIFVYTLPTPNDCVTTIMSRVMKKRFALFQGDSTKRRTVLAVDAALDLVSRGWVMDYKILGPRSWLASTWKDLFNTRLISSDRCTICQERFKDADLVVSLPCTHVFHGRCSREDDNGICKWLVDKDSCPNCRRGVCGALELPLLVN